MPSPPIDWTVPGILGALGGILWLMAAVAGGAFWHLSGRVERVEAWPTTEAVVLVNHWETYKGLNPQTDKWDDLPILKLEYRYEVEGRTYTGDQVNVPGTGGRFEDAAWPVGATMPVRYDPADPSVAGAKIELTDEMRLHWFLYLIAGLTALGGVFGGFGFRSWLRQRAGQV